MALPLLRLVVPSDVLPSLKVTVPPLSNVPEPGVTVAVNVTLWPNADVPLVDDVTVVVVLVWLTVCKRATLSAGASTVSSASPA